MDKSICETENKRSLPFHMRGFSMHVGYKGVNLFILGLERIQNKKINCILVLSLLYTYHWSVGASSGPGFESWRVTSRFLMTTHGGFTFLWLSEWWWRPSINSMDGSSGSCQDGWILWVTMSQVIWFLLFAPPCIQRKC